MMTNPHPSEASRKRDDGRDGGILFALAHPDDESFLCGGTIARYAANRTDLHLVCATRGEAGTAPPAMTSHGSIAEVRTGELGCAARALGLDSIHFLDYRDSGMPGSPHENDPRAMVNAPIDEISNAITRRIREVRPRIIVTHGSFGEYGHLDHIRLHEATKLAFQAAGDAAIMPAQTASDPLPWSPDALYVITLDPRRIRFIVRFLRLVRRDPRRLGRNADVDLVAIMEQALPATCTIDVIRWLVARDQAVSCHRSQSGRRCYLQVLPLSIRRWIDGAERYARLIPPVDSTEPIHDDLFMVSRAPADGDEFLPALPHGVRIDENRFRSPPID